MPRNPRCSKTGPTADSPCARKNADHLAPIALTQREQEVLGWIAQGKSSWEIGHIIQCEECTVNFHCRNIMEKLDVKTRAHALIKAVGMGLFNV